MNAPQALLRALRRHRSLPTAAALLAIAAAPGAAGAVSNPDIGTRPGEESPVHAQAALEADADGVHMALSWKKIQPISGDPDFTEVKDKFSTFLPPEGPGIASVRVIDAPQWAAESCNIETFKSCPPTPSHYDEFEDFVTEAVNELGPSADNDFDIPRWILWNEPSLDAKWGGRTWEQGSHREYSNLLVRFHDGVRASPNGATVSVEAGEIAAGGDKPVTWARKFTQYNSETGNDRNGNYDVLTIHAYAQGAGGVVDKVKQHLDMRGVTHVAVSEFGWAVGRPNPNAPGDADYKCTTEDGQRSKFRDTVEMIKSQTTGVTALVWLNTIDENKGKTKCLDNTGHYNRAKRDDVSPYGLFRRAPNAEADDFGDLSGRPILQTFQNKAGGGAQQRATGYVGDSPVLAPLSALPLSGLL